MTEPSRPPAARTPFDPHAVLAGRAPGRTPVGLHRRHRDHRGVRDRGARHRRGAVVRGRRRARAVRDRAAPGAAPGPAACRARPLDGPAGAGAARQPGVRVRLGRGDRRPQRADHQHRRPGVRHHARARRDDGGVRRRHLRRPGRRGDAEGPGAHRPALAPPGRNRRPDRRHHLRGDGRTRLRDDRERRVLHQRARQPGTRRHRPARLHLRAARPCVTAAAPDLHVDDRPRRRLRGEPQARRGVGGRPRPAGGDGPARDMERPFPVRHGRASSPGT